MSRAVLAALAVTAAAAGASLRAPARAAPTSHALRSSPAAWRQRAIYQLLTDRFNNPSSSAQCGDLSNYCGGTFAGITEKLDYITSMGFDAIWISPVVTNAPGGYHGFWATNLSSINSNFGSSTDLLRLSNAVHAQGMSFMVGVVGNHMAAESDPSGFFPFNDWSHFHDCNGCPSGCNINDYTNLVEMEHCRLDGLLDLNQSNPWVAQQLNSWVSNLVTQYQVDGLRLDTVPYVWPSFWKNFSAAAGVYIVGEVDSGNVSLAASYQSDGSVPAVLSYPLFFALRAAFAQQQSMNNIQSVLQAYAAAPFTDLSVLGTFLDNHDQPRFLSVRNDLVAYANGLTFVLMAEGIPIVYYGTESSFNGGNDPYCREALWPTGFTGNASSTGRLLATLNAFRVETQLWDAGAQVQRYSDDTFYAFTRGTAAFVALTNVGNNGATQTRTITYHPYSDGTTLCNILAPGGKSSDCITVANGQFSVSLVGGAPKVYAMQ